MKSESWYWCVFRRLCSTLRTLHPKVLKALSRLEYSYNKVKKLPINADAFDEETLEVWEGFTARFSRAVDLFLAKYLKACVLADDPGFQGSLRDFVDFGEKLGLVDSADKWMNLRGFRNLIAMNTKKKDWRKFLLTCAKSLPMYLPLKASCNASPS